MVVAHVPDWKKKSLKNQHHEGGWSLLMSVYGLKLIEGVSSSSTTGWIHVLGARNSLTFLEN